MKQSSSNDKSSMSSKTFPRQVYKPWKRIIVLAVIYPPASPSPNIVNKLLGLSLKPRADKMK